MNETIQKLKYLQEADKAMDERLRSLEKLCGNGKLSRFTSSNEMSTVGCQYWLNNKLVI